MDDKSIWPIALAHQKVAGLTQNLGATQAIALSLVSRNFILSLWVLEYSLFWVGHTHIYI